MYKPYQIHPAITVEGYIVNVMQFSGGERQIRLEYSSTDYRELGDFVVVKADLHRPEYLMDLMLIKDALDRQHEKDISLIIPYLPYSRQDRVCSSGEALSLKVFCNLINSMNFDRVTTWDCHSDVGLALLDRVIHLDQSMCFANALYEYNISGKYLHMQNAVIVAPDAGAIKKASKIAEYYHSGFVRADKSRDPKTGKITGTVVYSEHIGDKNFLIVDDICDAGGTFLELAKVLRPLTDGKIYLYTTHGIYSKGKQVFDGIIDEVFCYNDFTRFN